ncbi:MAG: peptide chain release factor 1 [Actinomycetota bacterium]
MTIPELPQARLKEIEARYEEIERDLADPSIAARQDSYRSLAKEHSDLRGLVSAWRQYRRAADDLAGARELLAGAAGDERAYIESEISAQKATLQRLAAEIQEALLPSDPLDERDVIVEVRAGAGGDEAGLFAAELLRMYSRYAEAKGWRTETLSLNETGPGALKEAIFAVKGKGAYSRLKHEAGVHRVQRVPVTESSGRIHTSAAAVIVLPEAEEVDVEIDPKDLRIDVYRSSGPGGQSVNTTDSAVRIKHLPTGVEVACQDEKSQLQNREKAMRILRARLLQIKQEEQQEQLAEERRSQVRTADRSEKIRTYNFQQNRVTDHRIGYTSHRLQEVLEGELDDLVDALAASERSEKLGA